MAGGVRIVTTRVTDTVTIADTASLSGASAGMAGRTLVGVVTPSGWTTAAIAFQVSYDQGTTYVVLLDATGAEYGPSSVVASRYVAIDPSLFLGITNLKIQSGTSAATVAQAGSDIVTLVLLESS